MSKHLIICASPLRSGKSAVLAERIAELAREKHPESEVVSFNLYEHKVEPCTECNECAESFRCVIKDDMQLLYPLIDDADELTVVSPVFFAGPPAQYKAVLDRLQVYYWKGKADKAKAPKRPLTLYVIGEGGDPHGFDPLVISSRSAWAVAGFRLEAVYNCVGVPKAELACMGEGVEDRLYPLPPLKKASPKGGAPDA